MVSTDLDQTTVHGEPRSGGDPPPDAVLERGALVDRYLVIGALGRGGGGAVYQAHDPELDRTVAIKLVERRAAEGEQSLVARALREGKSMARLSHPNVVAVHDVGTCDAGVFIAMELVDGVDLGQWLAQARRTPQQIVDVFRQAGEGLVEAHSRQLVHGDFKPANVFVGADGRVRVGDFGVARLISQAVAGPVGTPRYMAPEVHRGDPADERSDQFSFCLTLHEALARRHPLEGLGREALPSAAADLAPLTNGPAWLRRLVHRGTRPLPDERHASMRDIVDRLGAPRGRWWRLGLGVSIVAAATTAAIGFGRTPATVCEGSFASRVWNDDVRRELEVALRSPGGKLAQDTAARVLENTDAYVTRWEASYGTVCRATRIEGSQSELLLDVRVRCLHERRAELAQLLHELQQPSEDVIRRAVQALARVPAPELCETMQPAAIGPEAPPEAIADTIRDRRAAMVGARVSLRLGRYQDAAEIARATLEVAESSDFAPLIAEAKLMLGQSEAQMGRHDGAETLLQEAHWTAEAHHHDQVAAEAATELVFVLGELARRPDDALAWEPHARASITRSDDEGEIEADLLSALGAARIAKGDYQEALALFEQCADRRAQIYDEGNVEVISARANVGTTLDYLGRSSEAKAILSKSVAALEQALGTDHPEVARMMGNLAGVYNQLGELEEARELYERAVEIKRAVLGPDHPSLLATLNGLGVVCKNLEDGEAALEHQQAALAIGERSLGASHPALGSVLINLAQVHLSREQYADARASIERALTILRKAYGDRHPWIASAEMVLGAVALAEGKPDEAYRHHLVARDVFAEVYGDASENVALAESNLGRAQHRAGNLAQAREHLERARERLESSRPPRLRAVLDRLGELELDEGNPCAAQETLTRAHALRSEPAEESDPLKRARAACGSEE